jgi:hypothetical protein
MGVKRRNPDEATKQASEDESLPAPKESGIYSGDSFWISGLKSNYTIERRARIRKMLDACPPEGRGDLMVGLVKEYVAAVKATPAGNAFDNAAELFISGLERVNPGNVEGRLIEISRSAKHLLQALEGEEEGWYMRDASVKGYKNLLRDKLRKDEVSALRGINIGIGYIALSEVGFIQRLAEK